MVPVVFFLAALLAGSALHKALAHQRLAAAAARLSGLSRQGLPLLIVAGCLELAASVMLLLPDLRTTGALIAALVWTGYASALLRQRGRTLDCGCDLVAREKPVDWPLIARSAVLALLALSVAALPPFAFAAPGIDAPFAAAGLLALYLGASELLAIPHPRWRKS
ncbi:MAG: MauE/DoxX family redox-associated membrane protein [Novosphingobium sp.]